MIAILAAQGADEKRLTVLVIGLVVIALVLIALTVWYWLYTSPKRRRVRRRPVNRYPGTDVRRDSAADGQVRDSVDSERRYSQLIDK